MSYTIAVPASSIQKVLSYGISSITSVSGGVAVANGAVSITSSYPSLPPVIDPAFQQANVATGIATSSYNQANTATNLAQTVYDYANTISGGAAIDNVARVIASSASANTIILQGINITQNTWISTNNAIQTGINATQNTRLNSIETINTNQNTTIAIIQGVDATQNIRLGSIETINNGQNTTIAIIQSVDNTQNIRLSSIETVDSIQNTRIQSIETINTNQNTSIAVIQGVDVTQNTRLGSIETINTNQNTTISIIQGVDLWQNTQITAVNDYAAGAFAVANSISSGGVSAIDTYARLTANSAVTTNDTQNTRLNSIETINSNQNTTITQVNQFAAGAYATANGANGLASGAFSAANNKVASITGTTNQITVTGTTTPTLSLPQSINTTASVQFGSFGVGTAASGITGEIRATNEVTAYYSSDERLKENIQEIDAALYKLRKVRGVMFDWKDEVIEQRGGEDKYFVRKHDTGVIAQEIEQVLPEVVATRKDGYKAVRYEKLAGLIIQAINELADEVEEIKQRLK
jgi:hypothetical protein